MKKRTEESPIERNQKIQKIDNVPEKLNSSMIKKQEIFEIIKDENKKKMMQHENNEKHIAISNHCISEHEDIQMKDISQFSSEYEELQKFEQFISTAQNSIVYQPLKNTVSGNACETTDSRKQSEHSNMLMDIDTDDYFDKHEQTVCHSVYSKINPTFEPSSNLNAYRKPFVPKINKTKEKLKNLIPFLKEFNPKFLKKENIDKKILRKFRNYVKVMYKQEKEVFDVYDKFFWKSFTNLNLLPPMKFTDERDKFLEFKSFNTKYLLWLFSKNGTVDLFKEFANIYGNEILQNFIDAYNLEINSEEEGIIEKLKLYIQYIPDIYSRHGKLLSEKESICNLSYTTKLQSEEVLDYYIGDINLNNNKTMQLYNFPIPYPRCGKKFMDDDFYDSLNASMDSMQSVE